MSHLSNTKIKINKAMPHFKLTFYWSITKKYIYIEILVHYHTEILEIQQNSYDRRDLTR